MALLSLAVAASLSVTVADGPVWQRHTIDDSSEGADGVKLADCDGDGDPDIVCGWEEGGLIRAYLNPGQAEAAGAWPIIEVGEVRSPEDAIWADLDADGQLDVVSFSEGKSKAIHVHWAPSPVSSLIPTADSWKMVRFPWRKPDQLWMQGLAMDLDGRDGVDLVMASKGPAATISLSLSPKSPKKLGDWSSRQIRKSSWIMSLMPEDMDGDEWDDLLFVDRKGDKAGVFWLKNPGPEGVLSGEKWIENPVGALGREVMFLDVGDVNDDGRRDVAAAVKPKEVHLFFGTEESDEWESEIVELDGPIGTAKGVAIADLNLDGLQDLVFTCEHADGPLSGVVWLEQTSGGDWLQRPLGGAAGLKFDYPVTIDLDGDGDFDVVTCEERDQLGVVWYENPHR